MGWPLPVRWAWWLLHRPGLACDGSSGRVGRRLGRAGRARCRRGGGVVVGLVVWWRRWPGSFHRWPGRGAAGVVAVVLGLRGPVAGGDDAVGAGRPVRRPRVLALGSCGCGPAATRIGSRCAWWSGQHPADWARRLDALAHGFGARSCQVREVPRRPGYVQLVVGRRDPAGPGGRGRGRTGGDRRRGRADRHPGGRLALDGATAGLTHAGGGGDRVRARARCCWSLIRGLGPGGA